MAATIVSAIAPVIVASSGSLAKEELGRFLTVGNELKKLNHTVLTIQKVLADAEKKQHGDLAVKGWLEELEDILYDADDLLDDVSTEARRQQIMKDTMAKKVRKFFSKSNPLAHRLKIAHKIKAIRKKLDATADNKRLHLEVGHVEERVVRNRERDDNYSFVCAENVIGRDNDKKAVIGYLMDFNIKKNVSVLPIVGLGGMGKTTLAKLIYNDKEIGESFESKIWVCVSDDFVVKNIFKKILESITKEKPNTDEIDPLVSSLRQSINGRKYLLVLDDVWNEDQHKWSKLIEPLMDGAKGSRILVTTRVEKVAKITGTMNPYFLQGLDEQLSWDLLKQVAFENMQKVENPRIIKMGKEILKKCVGVPLAVKTIGYLLSFKDPETEWSSFINDELSKIPQNEDDILPTLKVSYDHLPSHLKQCFTYCSLFPKNYEMDKSLLIDFWIAQGFIASDERNRSLEDIGHDYFMDLLSGSFFQELKMDDFGNVSCKMHDLMHDLATKVIGSLITILDDEKGNVDKEKIRHVSIHVFVHDIVRTSLYEASKIRTFFHHYPMSSLVDCREIFRKFKFLRSLNLSSCEIKSVSSSIGDLKHLRYLDLSYNHNIWKLPNAIIQLQNLRTLKLSHCHNLVELPRDIKVLVNLRHLELLYCINLSYMPRGFGQLTNLLTLSNFVVDSGDFFGRGGELDELQELINLRGQLSIQNLRHGKDYVSKYKAANLEEKSHLHTLELSWGQQGDIDDTIGDEMLIEGLQPQQNLKKLSIEGYQGSRLPRWLWSLTNLVILKLSCPRCQYLPPLSRLPYLKNLELSKLEVMKDISDCSDNGDIYELPSSSSSPVPFFPSLEKLVLRYCGNVEWCWWRGDSSRGVNSDGDDSVEKASMTEPLLQPTFPRLSNLRIFVCPQLTSMPMFPHLEDLYLCGNLNVSTTTTSSMLAISSFTSLSKLRRLELSFIKELENLPEELLQNLVSLETLDVSVCDNLKSLFGIQYLTALKSLRIYRCLELEIANNEDWMQGPCLKNLLFLNFSNLPKLASLPLCLQHATSLQTFMISECEGLTAIPEWFRNCTSSLQSLEIWKCPILEKRCERNKGEDWPKIAHIPDIQI